MLRIVLGLILLMTMSQARLCIAHASQKNLYDNEAAIFKKSFPKARIIKTRGYYRFISGPYTDRSEALRYLKKAKNTHPDAYIYSCTSKVRKSPSHTPKAAQQPTQTKKQKVRLYPSYYAIEQDQSEEPKHAVKEKKSAKSKLEEPEFIERIIARYQQHKPQAYTLTFQEFLDRFFKNDYSAKNAFYASKLAQVQALIDQDRYDWNIYGSIALRYSKFIDYDLNKNKEAIADVGINIDKRLFDSGLLSKNLILSLQKRLAKIAYIDDKDKLSLLALNIYTQALVNQKLKKLYQDDYYNQKSVYELIKERYKAGVSSEVDLIDARNDLLALRRVLLGQLYDYLYSDFLLRNSIALHTKKPLELSSLGFSVEEESIEQIYRNAFKENTALQRERLRRGIQRARLHARELSFLPIVDFNAALFYEYKKDFALDPTNSAKGLNYYVGLNIKLPLYDTQNRSIYTQKAKLDLLMQRNATMQKMRDIAKDIHKSYNELKRGYQELKIINEQLDLMRKKMRLVKKRYLVGLSTYRQYSDALRSYIDLLRQKEILSITLLQNQALLNILQGRHIFYGEN